MKNTLIAALILLAGISFGATTVNNLVRTNEVITASGSDWQTVAGAATNMIISVADFGADGGGGIVDTASITSGDNTLTLSGGGYAFAATDVGKQITVAGAGAGGAVLETTIASYTSATSVELTAAASTTVSDVRCYWGADESSAINAAIVYAATNSPTRTVYFPNGVYRAKDLLTYNGVTLRGNGIAFERPTGIALDSSCIITPANGADLVLLVDKANTFADDGVNVTFRGIGIVGAGAGQTELGCKLYSSSGGGYAGSRFSFDDFGVADFSTNLFNVGGCNVISEKSAFLRGYVDVHIEGVAPHMTFISCMIGGKPIDGGDSTMFDIDNCVTCTTLAGDYGNADRILRIGSGSGNGKFQSYGSNIEGMTPGGVLIDSTNSIVILSGGRITTSDNTTAILCKEYQSQHESQFQCDNVSVSFSAPKIIGNFSLRYPKAWSGLTSQAFTYYLTSDDFSQTNHIVKANWIDRQYTYPQIGQLAKVSEEFVGGTTTSGQVGQNGWTIVSPTSSGSVSSYAETTAYWGIINVESGSTVSNTARLALYANTRDMFVALTGRRPWEFSTRFRLGNADIQAELGLLSKEDPANDMIGIKYGGSGNFYFVCRSGGTETAVDTGTAGNTSWHTLNVHCDTSGEVRFSIDNGIVRSITSNLTAAKISPTYWVRNLASGYRALNIDNFYGEFSR